MPPAPAWRFVESSTSSRPGSKVWDGRAGGNRTPWAETSGLQPAPAPYWSTAREEEGPVKTIFELYGGGDPRVHLSFSPYSFGPVDEAPSYHGGRVEMLISDVDRFNQEKDVIYIEGHSDAVRSMLTRALSTLDLIESHHRARANEVIARTVLCGRCQTYADPKNEWHGDGYGHACYGLAEQRLAIIAAEVADAPRKQAEEDARSE